MIGGDPWLRTAHALGERLVRTAVHHGGRCTWLTQDLDESGREPVLVERSCGPDLYAGTAGIGWVLAHLASATGDEAVRRTAVSALRHALAGDGTDLSLHSGRAGAAVAALQAGAVLSDDELTGRGTEAARAVAAGARATDAQAAGDPARAWDLMSGDAGLVMALLAWRGATGDDDFLDAAAAIGAGLVGRARRHGAGSSDGWSWPAAGMEPDLCGLAHGASGAALALGTLGRATGETRFSAGAEAALRYERSWVDSWAGWPDLRSVTRESIMTSPQVPYPTNWCHGSAGAGIARLLLLRQGGTTDGRNRTTLAEAAAAVDASTSRVMRTLGHRATQPVNLSVCHGVGSVVELHVQAAALTGDLEHLQFARRLALTGLGVAEDEQRLWDASSDATLDDDILRRAVRAVPSGLPGAAETPGLMLGTAGVVALLFSLSEGHPPLTPGLPL